MGDSQVTGAKSSVQLMVNHLSDIVGYDYMYLYVPCICWIYVPYTVFAHIHTETETERERGRERERYIYIYRHTHTHIYIYRYIGVGICTSQVPTICRPSFRSSQSSGLDRTEVLDMEPPGSCSHLCCLDSDSSDLGIPSD